MDIISTIIFCTILILSVVGLYTLPDPDLLAKNIFLTTHFFKFIVYYLLALGSIFVLALNLVLS